MAFVLCAFPAIAQTKPAPRLWVDRLEADFGRVKRGETARVSFKLENRGNADLKIDGAAVSLPGMSVRVKQHIAPGESDDLDVLWDTSQFHQEVEGQVQVNLNDPKVRQLNLTIVGTVFGTIDVLPYPIVFLSTFAGEEESRELQIVNNQDIPLEILGIESNGNSFKAEINAIEDSQRYGLKVSNKVEVPAGEYRDFLTILTDSPERPRIGIQVNVLIKPDIYLSQPTLNFGEIQFRDIKHPENRNFLTQTVIIQRRTGQMKIKDISSDLDIMMYAVEPSGLSNTFRLDFNLDPNKVVAGRIKGTISIATDDVAFPLIEVPVSGSIVD